MTTLPSEALPRSAHGVTRVYLIRHGQTDWNAEGRYQGHIDSALSTLGREQAARLAVALAAVPFRAIYSSPLSRARDTAAAIAAPHGLPVRPLDRLREVAMGEWEGLTSEEITARFGDILRARRRDPERITPGGGETLAELRARGIQVIGEMVARHPGETIAAVAHGGLNKTILLAVLDAPLSRYWAIRQDNGAINVLEFDAKVARVALLNETAHLEAPAPPRMKTGETPAAQVRCTPRRPPE
ncbi:MAG TPA: histidine phosphatase family protein [bacterium]|nr:histidine phosphatase family protein [bacterium]